MGRMKDIAIGMMEDHEQVQGDLFIDEELRTLMQNFKATQGELQAELNVSDVSLPNVSVQLEHKVFLLMRNGFPYRSYTDRALSFYECWVCTMGEDRQEEPDDYYVVEIMHDTSTYIDTGE